MSTIADRKSSAGRPWPMGTSITPLVDQQRRQWISAIEVAQLVDAPASTVSSARRPRNSVRKSREKLEIEVAMTC